MKRSGDGARLGLLVWLLWAGCGVADEPIWGKWEVSGNGCKKQDVQFLQSGSAMAVLFTSMGINFPKGEKGDGLMVNKRCTFRVEVTPPNGMYLGSMRQVYSGGLIKSKKAAAQIWVRYRLGSIRNLDKMQAWKRGEAIGPDSPNSVWQEEFNDTARNPICREKVPFVLDLDFMGMRDDKNEFMVGNLDSLDAAVIPELAMYPDWKPCRPRR